MHLVCVCVGGGGYLLTSRVSFLVELPIPAQLTTTLSDPNFFFALLIVISTLSSDRTCRYNNNN